MSDIERTPDDEPVPERTTTAGNAGEPGGTERRDATSEPAQPEPSTRPAWSQPDWPSPERPAPPPAPPSAPQQGWPAQQPTPQWSPAGQPDWRSQAPSQSPIQPVEQAAPPEWRPDSAWPPQAQWPDAPWRPPLATPPPPSQRPAGEWPAPGDSASPWTDTSAPLAQPQPWPGYGGWPPAGYGPYGQWQQGGGRRRARLGGVVATVVIAMLLAFAGGIVVDRGISAAANDIPGTAGATGAAGRTAGTAAGDPLPGFDVYRQALSLINQKYVNRSSVTDQQLLYGSISGLVDSLGDTGHSVFLTPDEARQEQQNLQGQLSGIGVIGSGATGTPTILRVLPGSPAEKAGLKAGDEIQAVDGKSTEGKTFSDIAAQVRGPAGTTVKLTVLHLGSAVPVDVNVTRAVIQIPLVDSAIVPGTKIAFIALFEFSKGASDDVKAAISQAQKQGATGIILDLRGNPGGYVDEAVNVVSQFVGSGNVYISEDAAGHQQPVPVNKQQTRTTLPLVVLVDHDSASASEIVSGALQDAARAQVVGVRTFGTGTVLNEFTLKDGSVIRLGVSNFLTPSGRKIFGNGITPNHVVALPAGVVPAEPADLQSMAPADVQQIKDAQLLEALKLFP